MSAGERPVYGFSREGTSLALHVLLLGGYRFVGRALIAAAQARGHTVTAFNRGNLAPLPGVEQLTGDRNDPVFPAGRRWDVAIDTSGYIPRHVAGAATALRDRIGQYVFISSLSVYPFPMPPGLDETAAVQTMPPGADPNDASDIETYGARKAACEAALEDVLPGRALHVRAGFIAGPYDNSDRFNSWIERAARPRPFIVPGDLDAPLQTIDVRDLAEWIVQMAERRACGVYNVTGPERPLRIGDVAQTCIDATGSRATLLPIPLDALEAAGIGWESLPFALPPDQYGIMQTNVDRAVVAGLRFRPLADTVRDTFAWLRSSAHERRVVFPPELERALIEKWAS
jgi:2'-hydroxyisoflavone reductase